MREVRAQVTRPRADRLEVSYAIEGELGTLRVPPPRTPRFAERLWQHTCCELFIARKGESAYREFNFSPSGEWAAYAFTRYREGAPQRDEALDPRITVRRSAGELRLDAGVACERGRLALALSAVIEDGDGRLSYWALAHAPGRPDFHHPEVFSLELD